MNHSVTWRDAVPADQPRILELWDEQEKRFAGTNVRVDRPQLFWEEGNRPQAIGHRPQEEQNQRQVLPLITADDADKRAGTAEPEHQQQQNHEPRQQQNQRQVLPLIHAEDADAQQGAGYSQNQNQTQSQNQEQHQHRESVATEEPRTQAQPAGWRYRPPIMRLRVAEKAGKIVGFRYVEAVPEVCLVTGDEDIMKTLGRELTEECYLFKRMGFRSGWGLVPEKFARALARFTRYSPVRLWNGLRLIGCDFSELGD